MSVSATYIAEDVASIDLGYLNLELNKSLSKKPYEPLPATVETVLSLTSIFLILFPSIVDTKISPTESILNPYGDSNLADSKDPSW